MLHRQVKNIEMPVPVSFYRLAPAPSPRGAGTTHDEPLLLMLHGFRETADEFLTRALGRGQPPPIETLAPNAPFPMPWRKAGKYSEAYSWYFRDVDRSAVLIPPEVAAQGLFRLLTALELAERRIVIAGFSQGGFFAPHIARLLPRVAGIVAVGAGFRIDEYQGVRPCVIHALHGADDQIVPAQNMLDGLRELHAAGFPPGQVKILDNLAHEMDDRARRAFRDMVGSF
ncbi:MAG: hypothetical protein RIQ81_2644 [Pseudomonadota bacterium]